MSKQVTIREFVETLREFQRRVERDAWKVPAEITSQIRRFIVKTATIDTTDLLVTLDWREFASNAGSAEEFIIEPHQRYGRKEGFTEFDRDHYFYGAFIGRFTGRRYYKQGIEAADLRSVFNEITFAAFE